MNEPMNALALDLLADLRSAEIPATGTVCAETWENVFDYVAGMLYAAN